MFYHFQNKWISSVPLFIWYFLHLKKDFYKKKQKAKRGVPTGDSFTRNGAPFRLERVGPAASFDPRKKRKAHERPCGPHLTFPVSPLLLLHQRSTRVVGTNGPDRTNFLASAYPPYTSDQIPTSHRATLALRFSTAGIHSSLRTFSIVIQL